MLFTSSFVSEACSKPVIHPLCSHGGCGTSKSLLCIDTTFIAWLSGFGGQDATVSVIDAVAVLGYLCM
jgi:hypothetical protein